MYAIYLKDKRVINILFLGASGKWQQNCRMFKDYIISVHRRGIVIVHGIKIHSDV